MKRLYYGGRYLPSARAGRQRPPGTIRPFQASLRTLFGQAFRPVSSKGHYERTCAAPHLGQTGKLNEENGIKPVSWPCIILGQNVACTGTHDVIHYTMHGIRLVNSPNRRSPRAETLQLASRGAKPLSAVYGKILRAARSGALSYYPGPGPLVPKATWLPDYSSSSLDPR
jgi:hypothetical protein